MKLVLVNIYPQETVARFLLSSYLLKGYLAKFAPDLDVQTTVLDFHENTAPESVCDKVLAEEPDAVGYSCYTWNISQVEAAAALVQKQRKVVHILGGPEITVGRIATLALRDADTFFVIGEGERVFIRLMAWLLDRAAGKDAGLPDGVARWNGTDADYRENRERIEDLNEIPSAYMDGLIEDRLYARQQAFLETQRGCRFKCKYCVYHKGLSSISYYSLDRVFAEIDHLILDKKVAALRIFDAIFTSDADRAKAIVRHLIDLKETGGVRLPWIYWEMTYRSVDEEFIALVSRLKYRDAIHNNGDLEPQDVPQHYTAMLKDYTAVNCFGIQSFNEKALRAISRTRVEQEGLARFMAMANRYNIALKIDLILGLPEETPATYFEGLDRFLPTLKGTDHVLNIHRLQILPGSGLEDLCGPYRLEHTPGPARMVVSTSTFGKDELAYASKITALLARVIDGPLRKYLYAAAEAAGTGCIAVIEELYRAIRETESFAATGLVTAAAVDDDYWNDTVFREIPSRWLIDYFSART